MRTTLSILFLFMISLSRAQVKIGSTGGTVNAAAILELNNELTNPPTTWRSFLPPQVNFSNPAFTSNTVWGIAGSPVNGAVVFNTGTGTTNGFTGSGLYMWIGNQWLAIATKPIPTDKIRESLTASLVAYDNAADGNWVNVTGTEYDNVLAIVAGSARYAASETYMNTTPNNAWTGNYTIGGNNNLAKVPPSNYIVAWSVKTGFSASASLGTKLKVSASQTSSYADYGNALPDIGSIAANTRVFFVLKKPAAVTPASLSYTAAFTPTTAFIGSTTGGGRGPEYYQGGDVNFFNSGTYGSDAYWQVISTATKQW